jgi:hypothetical protein
VSHEAEENMRSQRGEGRLSSIVWLLVFAVGIWAAWHALPPYVANFALNDKMNEIARSPRGTTTDEKVVDMLMKYVREERLDGYIQRPMFQVSTVETNRRITLEYDREVEILPGFKKKLHFTNRVEQPLIF